MRFTFKHVDDFCIATRNSPFSAVPGQVFKIDGKCMAAAGWCDGRLSFICKRGSWLDGFNPDDRYEFNGPIGAGFNERQCQKAIVVAGGTGIGAALSLLNARGQQLETHLLFYNRGTTDFAKLAEELGQTPNLTTLTQWDTARQGRPSKPLLPLQVRSDWEYDFKDFHCFVVGPKGLVDATREHCKELGLLDENFHLNY